MGYATLMVHLEVGARNTALLSLACDLAHRLNAGLTGIAACQPLHILTNEACMNGNMIEQDRLDIEGGIAAARAEFRMAAAARGLTADWRSAITLVPLHEFVAAEARSADLLLTRAAQEGAFDLASRQARAGDLVMHAGRPVLVAPRQIDRLPLEHVFVGWKDTREARRALASALPLLAGASLVTVVEIAADVVEAGKRVSQVADWLKRHGIASETLAVAANGDAARRLSGMAADRGGDLMVAGAYGHSRLREWVFGGVTRHLLASAERCALLSH